MSNGGLSNNIGNEENEAEHIVGGRLGESERSKFEKYASSSMSNTITNANIVFETKIRIIDILQVCNKTKVSFRIKNTRNTRPRIYFFSFKSIYHTHLDVACARNTLLSSFPRFNLILPIYYPTDSQYLVSLYFI